MPRIAPRWLVWILGVLALLGWVLLIFVFAIGNTVLAHNSWWNANVDFFGVGGIILGFCGTWAWIAVAVRNRELEDAYGTGMPNSDASGGALAAPIDQFLAGDRARVAVLRGTVRLLSAVAAVVAVLATYEFFTTDVSDTDPGGISVVLVAAFVVALVGLTVGDQLVSDGPRLAAMRAELSTSMVWVNQTMPSVEAWAASTHPEVKGRLSGRSYIALSARQLSIWRPRAGRLWNVAVIQRDQMLTARTDSVGALVSYAGLIINVKAADGTVHEIALAPALNAASGINGKRAANDLFELLGVPETPVTLN